MTGEAPAPSTSARLSRRARSTSSGMLLAAASMPAVLLEGARGPLWKVPVHWQAVAGVTTLLALVAALVIGRRPGLGRGCASVAVVGVFALGWPSLVASPQGMLAALTAAALGLVLLWRIGAPLLSVSDVQLRTLVEGQAQGAGLFALVFWMFWELSDASASQVNLGALCWTLGVALVLAAEWALRCWRSHRRAALVVGGAVLVSCTGFVLQGEEPSRALQWLVLAAGAGAVVIRRPERPGHERAGLWESIASSPERLFVGTFAALCVVGTLVLALPQSAASGEAVGLLDAAFTATSAVCVTGLAVLDTGRDFSGFGQAALLTMIQVGGLGIMTFSTAALWALGRRLSLRHEGVMASLISTRDRSQLFGTARQILLFTLSAEAVGTLVLTLAFMGHGDAFGTALWRGLFTAVSAFCNAGFALQSDSLVGYQQSALVLHTVGVLIVLGGLSPLTVLALPHLVGRSTRPVPAQVKLGLSSAGLLLGLGFMMFLAVEWGESLDGLSALDRLHNAWFQSVTLRTAGFNSVDFAELRGASLTWMLVWMFIGGSPGGTAGGVKTTTMAVVVLAVLQAIRGQSFLEIYGRRIPERTRNKAVVVLVVATTSGVLALLALQLTQRMPTQMAVFEVVSALGTVGLTLGGTARLDGIGKIIILACMFVGRVGGLSLLMFLKGRRVAAALDRPEEEIDVG